MTTKKTYLIGLALTLDDEDDMPESKLDKWAGRYRSDVWHYFKTLTGLLDDEVHPHVGNLAQVFDERSPTYKIPRVFDVEEWFENYAKELSARGKDSGSPEAITRGARDAQVVREALRQFLKGLQ